MHTFRISTRRRNELIDITERVQEIVKKARVSDGVCCVYIPHTTAAVLINENADPSVCADILSALERLVPEDAPYTHTEGNSDAHVKAAVIGSSRTILVSGGRLALGRWQGIFFCEFDGPREREIWVEIR
jgi:secondary thiamine-phosphate synthase enzyme